jgi:hypothetical protein
LSPITVRSHRLFPVAGIHTSTFRNMNTLAFYISQLFFPLCLFTRKTNYTLSSKCRAIRILLRQLPLVNYCIEYWLYIGQKDERLHEPASDQLRTIEQLGYVISNGFKTSATTLGFRYLPEREGGAVLGDENREFLEKLCRDDGENEPPTSKSSSAASESSCWRRCRTSTRSETRYGVIYPTSTTTLSYASVDPVALGE